MAEIKEFYGGSKNILIEIEDASDIKTSSGNLGKSMQIIQDIANAVFEQVEKIPEEKRPSEFEISFGLKALKRGTFAVSVEEGKHNFRVRLKWAESPVKMLEVSPETAAGSTVERSYL